MENKPSVFVDSNPRVLESEDVIKEEDAEEESKESEFDEASEVRRIDTNGNGLVTIAEAKAAGYNMPVYSSHWLYKYMRDGDSDGMVGE